ncbi:MAG: pilus (MSHA type) biogenesis protein MshL [Gammaproteobacteria bacterium]|nr:pilus (MSHA type) biogenesis protein MshL [Gammaproteobacteria bacterium]
MDEMETVLDESVEGNRVMVPDSVSSALIPTIKLGSERVQLTGDEQRFDISVNDVPADQFFLSLVDGTRYNMVVHPEVSGVITLNLSNVTIPEVLEAVRDVYGYEFVSTDYGFQVLPGRLQARIYQINYLNIDRVGRSSTIVSSGSLTTGESSTTDDDRTTIRSGGNTNLVGTSISTSQPETTFWTELSSSVQAIVGTGEGRSVVVNPQSGVVVVRALPNELREVEEFLKATQLIVQRQVILEAKILEVRLNDKFQTGINWGAVLNSGNKSAAAGNIGGGSVLVNETGVSDISGLSSTVAGLASVDDPAGFPIAGTLTSAFGGVFTLALDLTDFTAFIELLKVQGNVQVLSSPRVATLNNQKAVIKVGTDEFFVTDISNTTVTGTSTTVSPSITLTPFFSGIALDVTPQISHDNLVTLHVHPSVSEVVDQQKTVTIGTLTQQLPLARSTVRESDSIVRAASGQVVVIGGLMQDLVNDQQAGAPGLSDLPVVGSLFKHTNKTSTKSELVILLRPIVVDDDQVWMKAMNQSSNNLRGLRKDLGEQNWVRPSRMSQDN